MNKQILKRLMFLGAALVLAASSLPAFAQSHGGGHGGGMGGMGGMHAAPAHPNFARPNGGGRGGGWHGGGPGWWGLGLGIGLGWSIPYYGYPYPDYYSSPIPPGVIVETPPVDQTPGTNWYYCASAQAYFPYVSQCPEAWQVVPAMPPAQPPGQ